MLAGLRLQANAVSNVVYLITLIYLVCSCDLDLDRMTLIQELDLVISDMYPRTKN